VIELNEFLESERWFRFLKMVESTGRIAWVCLVWASVGQWTSDGDGQRHLEGN